MRSLSLPILGCCLVALFLYNAAAAQAPPAEQSAAKRIATTFKISGRVVSDRTGAPLSQARVSLADTADQSNTLSVLTTEDGRFAFSSLKRGKFALHGAKRGFIGAFYEQHEEFSTAIVTGPALDTENLLLSLTPLALISGKVFDEVGEGVRQAAVTLYVQDRQAGLTRVVRFDSDTTDDQGHYEFAGLPPGDYFLSVSAKPWYAIHGISPAVRAGNTHGVPSDLDVAYPTTFNNGATDSQGASPISVHGGDHSQVDIHVSPVPVLHLVFRGPDDPQQGLSMPMFQKRTFDTVEFVSAESAQQISPGLYEVTGVPAGKYSFGVRNPQTGRMQQTAEMNLSKDGQELDLSQSEPVADINFSIEMPHHDSLPKQLYIGLQDERGQRLGFFPVDTSGHVTFVNVPARKYLILAFAADKRYSVTRAVVGGAEVSPRQFTVLPGSSADARIYLTSGVVTVEGFVKRGSKPASGIMVALIPKDPQVHGDMFRRDQSDSDGSFVLRGVIPGTYTLVAIEDAWDFAWNQPEVLNRYAQRGQNLTVGALMTNAVHLPEPVQVQPR